VDTDVTKHFADGLRDLAALAQRVADSMGPDLERALTLVRETVARGGTLFFCGNGEAPPTRSTSRPSTSSGTLETAARIPQSP
jgi:hypothetical protein